MTASAGTRTAHTRVRCADPSAADRPGASPPIVHPAVVVPLPGAETGEARYVIFTVLLGSWLVAVTAAKVLIPPVPLLVFLLARMVARRRRRARA